MKNLLIASAVVVASAGVAAAGGHMTWSYSGEFGVARQGDGTTTCDATNIVAGSGSVCEGGTIGAVLVDSGKDTQIYSGLTAKLTVSGESDNGITWSADLEAEAASQDYDPGDWEFDGSNNTLSFGNVTIGAGPITLIWDHDGRDNLYDDDSSHDVEIQFASGSFSAAATVDVDDDASDGSSSSFSFGFEQNGFSASLVADDNDDCNEVSLGYATDVWSVGYAADGGCAGPELNTLSASFTTGGVTLGAEFDDDDTWEATVDASLDPVTVNLVFGDDGDDYWEAVLTFDAGGGLALHGGVHSDESFFLGGQISG